MSNLNHPFYDALRRFALDVMTHTGQPVTRVEVTRQLHDSIGRPSKISTAAGEVQITPETP